MESVYSWDCKSFKNLYTIKSQEKRVGKLQIREWKSNSTAEIGSSQFEIKRKGFWRQTLEVYDSINQNVISEVSFSTWKSKAMFDFRGKSYTFESKNFWNSKWEISNNNEAKITFTGSNSKGEIKGEIEEADLPLVLIGLYIRDYYLQIVFISLLVVFISVMSTTISTMRH